MCNDIPVVDKSLDSGTHGELICRDYIPELMRQCETQTLSNVKKISALVTCMQQDMFKWTSRVELNVIMLELLRRTHRVTSRHSKLGIVFVTNTMSASVTS